MARTTAVMLVSLVTVLGTAAASRGGISYADGSKINLGTIRGAVAQTSTGGADAKYPLHAGYEWDCRVAPSGGHAWWQVDLGGLYNVKDWAIGFWGAGSTPGTYDTTDFTLQTSSTGLAGSWATQATVTGNVVATPSGTFAGGDVMTRFIRIDATAFTDGQMIIRGVRFRGTNNPAINPDISMSQSTWNGGVASGSTWGGVAQANDDGTVASWFYGTSSSATPGPLVITLNDLYPVRTIGITNFDTAGDNRALKNVDVYLSPSASGDTDWLLAKSIRNFNTAAGTKLYQEFDLDRTLVNVKRVKLDNIVNYGGSQTYIQEIFLYIPEPASLSLLALGGLALPRRRR